MTNEIITIQVFRHTTLEGTHLFNYRVTSHKVATERQRINFNHKAFNDCGNTNLKNLLLQIEEHLTKSGLGD